MSGPAIAFAAFVFVMFVLLSAARVVMIVMNRKADDQRKLWEAQRRALHSHEHHAHEHQPPGHAAPHTAAHSTPHATPHPGRRGAPVVLGRDGRTVKP